MERTSIGRAVLAFYPAILFVWIVSAVVVLKLVSLAVSGHVAEALIGFACGAAAHRASKSAQPGGAPGGGAHCETVALRKRLM